MSDNAPGSEEWIRRVEEGISRMKRLDREIFLAVRFDNLSYDEVAQRFGITTKRVERAIVKVLFVIRAARSEQLPPWWKFWRR